MDDFFKEDETGSFRLPSIHVCPPMKQSDGSPPCALDYDSFLLEKRHRMPKVTKRFGNQHVLYIVFLILAKHCADLY